MYPHMLMLGYVRGPWIIVCVRMYICAMIVSSDVALISLVIR
jgi:hypothetical protein